MSKAEWPSRITCEVSGCSRVIKPAVDQFSVISIDGNVISSKGSKNSKAINIKFVACASCSKKLSTTKFKRRNNNLNLG